MRDVSPVGKQQIANNLSPWHRHSISPRSAAIDCMPNGARASRRLKFYSQFDCKICEP